MDTLMNPSWTYKIAFIVCVLISVVGFVQMSSVWESREQRMVCSTDGDTPEILMNTTLNGGHSYIVEVTLYQSAPLRAAVNGTIRIYVNGSLVKSESASDLEVGDEDSDASASVTVGYRFQTDYEATLVVNGTMHAGDQWTVEVYRDLPFSIKIQFMIYMIMFGAPLVILCFLVLFYLMRYTLSPDLPSAVSPYEPVSV